MSEISYLLSFPGNSLVSSTLMDFANSMNPFIGLRSLASPVKGFLRFLRIPPLPRAFVSAANEGEVSESDKDLLNSASLFVFRCSLLTMFLYSLNSFAAFELESCSLLLDEKV